MYSGVTGTYPGIYKPVFYCGVMQAYDHFIHQLDAFRRRYYLDRAFRGFLVFCIIFVFLFLLFTFVEFFAYFSVSARTIIFWSVSSLLAAVFCFLVLAPWFQSKRLLPGMNYRQICEKLSLLYPELGDRLINALDLLEQFQNAHSDLSVDKPSISHLASVDFFETSSLLQSAITQITDTFLSYRFEKAIRLKNSMPILFVVIFFLSLLSVLWISVPRFFSSSQRLVNYHTSYQREFPFDISIDVDSLHVEFDHDFELNIRVTGTSLPSELFIRQGTLLFPCQRITPNLFRYVFRRVQHDLVFSVETGKFSSQLFSLDVDYRSILQYANVTIDYPSYTGLRSQVLDQQLDFMLPKGTQVDWSLKFHHSSSLRAWVEPVNDSTVKDFISVQAIDSGLYQFNYTFFDESRYFLEVISSSGKCDTLSFTVKVLPDRYPSISVSLEADSHPVFFKSYRCRITDDYGFSSLLFVMETSFSTQNPVRVVDTLPLQSILLGVADEVSSEPSQLKQSVCNFTYFLDLSKFNLDPSQELVYWFSVKDNDPFFPYKESVSEKFSFRKPSINEMSDSVANLAQHLQDKMSLTLGSLSSLSEQIEQFTQNLLNKRNLEWEDQQFISQILEDRRKLQTEFRELQEELKQQQSLRHEIQQLDSVLESKQQQLNELFEKLFDQELMSKLNELQQLMQKNASQEELMESVKQFQYQHESFKTEVDRNLDLYRQLEFETNLDKLRQDLESISSQSHKLADEMNLGSRQFSEKKSEIDSLHQQLQSDFNRITDDLQRLDQLNHQLDKPTQFQVPSDLVEKILESMSTTDKALQSNQSTSSQSSHQKTDKLLDQLSENISEQYQDIQQQTMAEDAEYIRLLLKSIIRVSQTQEDIMLNLQQIRLNDPQYSESIKRQSALNILIHYVADSITAISRRQPQVALSTRDEVSHMLLYSRESLEYLLGMNNIYHRRYGMVNSWALTRQQYTITALNNLALLLAESLENIQQQLQQNSSGKGKMSMPGSQQKPGGDSSKKGSPSMKMPGLQSGKSLEQLQSELNKQLEQLKKSLEQQGLRKSSGSGNQISDGNASSQSFSSEEVSEEFAKAAYKQEMIRRMVQERIKELQSSNPNAASIYRSVLGQMETTERDLVNKMIDQDLLRRQNKIQSRLLDASDAELTQEQDHKRKSERAHGIFSNPSRVEILGDTLSRSTINRLRFNNVKLQPYYQLKYQDYIYKITE